VTNRTDQKSFPGAGQALSDFNIFKLVAHYWGCEKMFEKWSSPESVFQILKELIV
jgi:assimilatory nitrate reductase catalytic subunit